MLQLHVGKKTGQGWVTFSTPEEAEARWQIRSQRNWHSMNNMKHQPFSCAQPWMKNWAAEMIAWCSTPLEGAKLRSNNRGHGKMMENATQMQQRKEMKRVLGNWAKRKALQFRAEDEIWWDMMRYVCGCNWHIWHIWHQWTSHFWRLPVTSTGCWIAAAGWSPSPSVTALSRGFWMHQTASKRVQLFTWFPGPNTIQVQTLRHDSANVLW